MTEATNNEFSATDMATAAADGFRDGQKVALAGATNNASGTPSSRWAEAGEQDPHGARYSCERAALALGHLSDDELANGAFMNYDRMLDIQRIMAGDPDYHSPIAWMTAVKDRIRWLSRRLEECEARTAPPAAAVVMPWFEGAPPHPWNKEWFIAETTYGGRVVLRALHDEHSYDYKTADETFMMARNIKRWCQFPDSEYVKLRHYPIDLPAYSDERGSDGKLTYEAKARNAALDEVARLNPAPDHSEHALGMVPADHVEHVRAMVVPEVVAIVTTAHKRGVSEQRALWHGQSGADQWIDHFKSRGCSTTKTDLMTVAQHNAIAASLSADNQRTAPAPPLLADRHPMDLRQPVADEREAFCDGHCTWLDHHPSCAALSAPAAGQDVGALTTGQILALERRSGMTDDEALRFARSVESAIMRQPVAWQDVSALVEPTIPMVQAACAAFRMDISPTQAMYEALCAALAANKAGGGE